MYRLFIVDDNIYERNGLKKRIDWNRLGIEVVGDFEDGEEAFGRIDDLKPHIVITDIAMPVMNGIEMSERIRKQYPDIKVIFISCHSDFEFAKSAVDLGVYSYVLKPIISDELVVAVEKLVQELDAGQRASIGRERTLMQIDAMLPLVQEQFVKELLLGNFNEESDIRGRMAFLKLTADANARIRVMSVRLADDVRRIAGEDIADGYVVSYAVKNVVASKASASRAVFPVQISADTFAAIVLEGERDSAEMNLAVDLIEEIGGRLNVAVTIGMSKAGERLADIPALFEQSQKAVHTKFYGGSNPVITFEEIEDRTDGPFQEMPHLEPFYQDVKALMAFGGKLEIQTFVDQYLNARVAKEDGRFVKGFAIMLVYITRFVLQESNPSYKELIGDESSVWKGTRQPDSLTDVKRDIVIWLSAIIERMSERNTTKNAKVVETIKLMIRRRYREQLMIEDICKSVFLSARHANALFKKETGKTIFDYLVEVRIEKAKSLLMEPDSKVAVVAEAAGYLSNSYFCLAFKKNVGITPAEFKNRAYRP